MMLGLAGAALVSGTENEAAKADAVSADKAKNRRSRNGRGIETSGLERIFMGDGLEYRFFGPVLQAGRTREFDWNNRAVVASNRRIESHINLTISN